MTTATTTENLAEVGRKPGEGAIYMGEDNHVRRRAPRPKWVKVVAVCRDGDLGFMPWRWLFYIRDPMRCRCAWLNSNRPAL